MKKFYVTTPIYYVNDVPHLGTAYTTIVADVLARYHRVRGVDTWFLTGTDEHGLKIERAAHDAKQSPQEFVDHVSTQFRNAWAPLNCEPNDFIRTTEPRHIEAVQRLWAQCVESGSIYKGTYEGLYCVGCECFYTEKELLSSPEGFLCQTHKKPVERVREPSYFFKLSAYQQRLLSFYERNPGFISPESRRNEVLAFVREGLTDLSVSRTSFSWGIPVPNAPKHVMYVWFDALANYWTALGPKGNVHARFWPADVHLVGKDILRFHAIYWPAFLMAAGFSDEQLPHKIFAHGWLTVNGEKMSKQLRNVVEPLKLARVFSADIVRFYLLREVAFGQDGDFSHAQLIARYNSELADSLGNLLNRTLGLCTKLRSIASIGSYTFDGSQAQITLEEQLVKVAQTTLESVIASFESIAPHRAIDSIWSFCRAANKYVDESAPWAESKKGAAGAARVDTILAHCLETLRWISTLLWPVMPDISTRIREQLGLEALRPTLNVDQWSLQWTTLWSNEKLSQGVPVFPKIDAEKQAEIFKELGLSETSSAPNEVDSHKKTSPSIKPSTAKTIAPPAAEISYDEFSRIDIRVGTILAAERVPKSEKLLKLQVDIGEESTRQIVAGIGKSWEPSDLIGRQVTVIANLKPAKLMGLESRGMILAVANYAGEDHDLALISTDKPRTNGMRVK